MLGWEIAAQRDSYFSVLDRAWRGLRPEKELLHPLLFVLPDPERLNK